MKWLRKVSLPAPAPIGSLTFALLLSLAGGALAATPGAAEAATPHSRPADNLAGLAEQGPDLPEHLARRRPAPPVQCSVRATLQGFAEHSASFLPAGRSRQPPKAHYFVGVLAPASTPMACRPRAVAGLMGPLTTTGVEHERTELQCPRPWPPGLRKPGRPKGAAALNSARCRCSAKAQSQESWSAVAASF